MNFISSADGRATFHGRSGQLGDDGDRAMFHGLREHVDAVLAGTRTIATESYGRILGKELAHYEIAVNAVRSYSGAMIAGAGVLAVGALLAARAMSQRSTRV